MIRGVNIPVIALGGMDKRRAKALRSMKIHGWGAISALAANNQKRKAVPT
jgi:thiamine-phosphate pyrophosphorylase